MKPYENLHIDIISQQPSPLSQKISKGKALMRLTTRFIDFSPNKSPKVDPETFEYWYHESKNYLKQVFSFLSLIPLIFCLFFKLK